MALAALLVFATSAAAEHEVQFRYTVIGYVKESAEGENAVAVAIALANSGPREFWFHFGNIEIGPRDARRQIKSIENLVTGERHTLEWGGVRLRIDQQQDPALLFRCLA